MQDKTVAFMRTSLFQEHQALGAKIVPFAGYEMPLSYQSGILAEHRHVREKCGVFDVGHMGQYVVEGPDFVTVARALERISPSSLTSLAPGQMRYSVLLTAEGGIVDDLIFLRPPNSSSDSGASSSQPGRLLLITNAARKQADLSALRAVLPETVQISEEKNRALLAVQGPLALQTLVGLAPDAARSLTTLRFMHMLSLDLCGVPCRVSRSGYTGEDGFEISAPNSGISELFLSLLAQDSVLPIGLGARDSLRLEAGLCLYGQDIDMTTTPVQAGLGFVIPPSRRAQADFLGAEVILKEFEHGPPRRRRGFFLQGRVLARSGTPLLLTPEEGSLVIGRVTSGLFGPSCGRSIAMGYIDSAFEERLQLAPNGQSQRVFALIRGHTVPADTVSFPFFTRRGATSPIS